MGRFETEMELTLQQSLQEPPGYANIIGTSNDLEDLQAYSNYFLIKFIEKNLLNLNHIW